MERRRCYSNSWQIAFRDKVIGSFVGDKEYVATIDESMNWLVLFSITGFIEEEYAIQAQVVENNNNLELIKYY